MRVRVAGVSAVTLYGIDIAQYQAGESLAVVKAEGFSWVEARASTGFKGGTVDPQFATFKAQARAAGLPLVAYHFLYSHGIVSIQRQAEVCAAAVNDRSIPILIDHETADGTGTPSIPDALEFAVWMRGLGYRVPLWYLPRWVWQRLGMPKLPDVGMRLVASSYVTGAGYASSLYPGKSGAGWSPYGGLTPVIWQFTDQALVDGQHVDADAFEGTAADLAALLNLSQPGGSPMERWYVIEDGALKIVPQGTPGAVLAHPLDSIDGHYVVEQIQALAAKVDELAKQNAPTSGALQVTGTLNLNGAAQ